MDYFYHFERLQNHADALDGVIHHKTELKKALLSPEELITSIRALRMDKPVVDIIKKQCVLIHPYKKKDETK